MKRILLTLAAAAAAIAPAQALSPAAEKGEARLARALEGRVAGAPVDCIDLRRVRSSRIIPGTAIVYEAGGTLYVNRPRAGADTLDSWDVMVNKLHDSRLCSIDVVELYDTGARIQTGIVFLGDFVPYKRAVR
jgi:hypothetical protein